MMLAAALAAVLVPGAFVMPAVKAGTVGDVIKNHVNLCQPLVVPWGADGVRRVQTHRAGAERRSLLGASGSREGDVRCCTTARGVRIPTRWSL